MAQKSARAAQHDVEPAGRYHSSIVLGPDEERLWPLQQLRRFCAGGKLLEEVRVPKACSARR